jgi:hypothetical protein
MNDEENSIRGENDPREPYEAPKLEVEDLFETLALACGKVQPLTFQCRQQPRNS